MAKEKKKNKEESYSFFYSLIKRFTIFLFLFLTAMLMLYFSGNFQSFQDASLRLILFCSSIASVMLIFFSCIGFFDSIVMIITFKNVRYAISMLTYLLLAAVVAAVFISLRGLTVLMAGIH